MAIFSNFAHCEIKGENTLRFINLCKHHEIELNHIKTTENGFEMDIYAKDFKRLRPLIRKTHVKIHILNRKGVAFFFYHHKKRWWFLVGLALFSFFIWYMSLFIWKIEIEGNSKYTDALLLQYLRSVGIDTGVKKSELSMDEIEEELRIQYNEITWVSATMVGTKLEIHLREGELKTDTDSSKAENQTNQNDVQSHQSYQDADANTSLQPKLPSHLTAKYDAVITSLVVRHGTPVAKIGDEVKAGDMLVEGIVYIYNDDQTVEKIDYKEADADILGNYDEIYDKVYTRKYNKKVYTKKSYTSIGIKMGNRLITLPDFNKKESACEKWSWEKQLRVASSFYLPFSVYYTEYRPYEMVEAMYTDHELQVMAKKDLENYLCELKKKGVQIIANNVTISLDDYQAHYSGVLSLNGPIAQSVPIDSANMAWNH